MSEPITITFYGYASKKNSFRSKKGGGVMIDTKARAIIQEMEKQVPGNLRDLNLVHPDVEVFIHYTFAGVDRDNIFTTALDVLGKYHVIRNDNIAQFNGQVTIHPAVRSDCDEVTVVLYPKEEVEVLEKPAAPRYIDPKRQRMQRRLESIPVVPVSDPIDELEDAPVGLFEF